MTHTRIPRAALLFPLLAGAAATAQPSFQGLGDFSGGAFESSADGVSADGTVVVGFGTTNNGAEAFRWSSVGGMVGLGFIDNFGQSGALGVSADGSVVVGNSDSLNGIQAFRWTQAGGMDGLGDIAGGNFGSAAGAVTLDGRTVVGIGDLTGNGGQAFRWTAAAGMVGLGDLPGGVASSIATGISSDGAIIVGTGDFVLHSQGQAFRRVPNGMVGLGDLAGGPFHSIGHFVSYDGSVVVGIANSAYGVVGFRWAGGVMGGLSDFAGGAVASEARACNADGSIVVGSGTDAAGQKAFIWTSATGMKNLQDLLIAKGVTGLDGWTLKIANACSGDGTVIVGEGLNPDGNPEGWIARTSAPCNSGTTRASLGSPGDLQANNGSASGSISQNGFLVAFESTATNLVTNDTNGRKDIFVRNRPSNWTTRVSLTNAGFQANGDSWAARINAKDGRFVVFASSASNLVPGDTNGKSDIFLRDRVNNTTTMISVGLDGKPGNGASDQPQISGDGRYIAYQSTASNLAQNGNSPYAFNHIFLKDRTSGTTTLVSVNSSGTFANGACGAATVSNDGRYIGFTSDASNLSLPDSVDNNLVRDIFVRDKVLAKTRRISISTAGTQANKASTLPRMSGTGRYIAFTSSATNLVSGDTNAKDDVFIRDIFNGTTVRASIGPGQIEPNANCSAAAISSSGRFILYNSGATNLVPHDTNGAADAFVYDTWSMTNTLASLSDTDQQAASGCTGTALTADGRAAVFHSTAGNLTLPDAGFSDVFVRDLCKP